MQRAARQVRHSPSMPLPTPTPHVPSARDDASRLMARIAAGGLLIVLTMVAVIGWSRWQDTRQRAQIVLHSYASVYARSYAQQAHTRAMRLRDLATRLQAAAPHAGAGLER